MPTAQALEQARAQTGGQGQAKRLELSEQLGLGSRQGLIIALVAR